MTGQDPDRTGPGTEPVEPRRRLHPLSPLLHSARTLAVIVAAISIQGFVQLGLAGFLGTVVLVMVFAVAWSVITWAVTGYHVVGRELRIHDGVLVRRSRAIPLERLQSVELVRPLLARLAGLAELRLEVVGGSKTEAPLAFLTVTEAAALREWLLALAARAGAPAGAGEAGQVGAGHSPATAGPTPATAAPDHDAPGHEGTGHGPTGYEPTGREAAGDRAASPAATGPWPAGTGPPGPPPPAPARAPPAATGPWPAGTGPPGSRPHAPVRVPPAAPEGVPPGGFGVRSGTDAAPERPLHAVVNRDLVIGQILTPEVMLLPVAVAAVVAQYWIGSDALSFVVLASMLLAIIGVVRQPVRRVMADWNFRLALREPVTGQRYPGLRVRHGLTELRSQTVPLNRVQAVGVTWPFLWRRRRWLRCRLDVAGVAAGDGEVARPDRLLPVGDLPTARRLVREVLPGTDLAGMALVPPPARARWLAPWRQPVLGAALADDVLAVRDGRITRRLVLVPYVRVQSVRVTQGPVQRMLGLATVHADTAGALTAIAHHRALPDARHLAAELTERARLAREAEQAGSNPDRATGPATGPEPDRARPSPGAATTTGAPAPPAPPSAAPPETS